MAVCSILCLCHRRIGSVLQFHTRRFQLCHVHSVRFLIPSRHVGDLAGYTVSAHGHRRRRRFPDFICFGRCGLCHRVVPRNFFIRIRYAVASQRHAVSYRHRGIVSQGKTVLFGNFCIGTVNQPALSRCIGNFARITNDKRILNSNICCCRSRCGCCCSYAANFAAVAEDIGTVADYHVGIANCAGAVALNRILRTDRNALIAGYRRFITYSNRTVSFNRIIFTDGNRTVAGYSGSLPLLNTDNRFSILTQHVCSSDGNGVLAPNVGQGAHSNGVNAAVISARTYRVNRSLTPDSNSVFRAFQHTGPNT